jgi:hypothetical protein
MFLNRSSVKEKPYSASKNKTAAVPLPLPPPPLLLRKFAGASTTDLISHKKPYYYNTG